MRYDRINAVALARARRARAVAAAADRLQRQVERQDAARYRDWPALVEAVLDVGDGSVSDFIR